MDASSGPDTTISSCRRLDGRVAIVTGGSRGIGRAVVERLAHEVAKVAIVSLHAETVREATNALTKGGAEVIGVAADVSNELDTLRYVSETIGAFGRIDILVNNAGISNVDHLIDISVAQWDEVFEVNVRETFLGCREVARQMIQQGTGGRIVNCASGAGRRGSALIAAYSARKFAVIGFTQCIAAELAPHGIAVNACCPGLITVTKMWDSLDAGFARLTGPFPGKAKNRATRDVPLARSGRPDEIAAVIAFLVSDDASYMTGESVVVDGGQLRY